MSEPLHLPSLDELARDPASRSERRRLDASVETLGGKGSRLVWLVRHGFTVPNGVVIPSSIFESVCKEVLPPGHDVRTLLRLQGTRDGTERAGRAPARIREAKSPRALELELARLATELGAEAPWGLAVRSSATCEDGVAGSLAGLATTHLGVRGHAGLVDAVRDVWASLFLPRALVYLGQIGVQAAAMAVVIQVVIKARASAVAVAEQHVVAGQPGGALDVLVNATWGLGGPIVSGHATPDVVRIRVSGGESHATERVLAHKPRMLLVGEHGTEVVEVPTALRDAPALEEARLAEIVAAGDRLTHLGRGPWEIEVAVDGHDVLHLLQARPVVERGFPEGGDATTVWSCTNLAEALPGVATPLTWSVAETFSELGFRRAFAALGCSVPRGTKFVANVHGRFYLNLTAFMRVAAAVPGLDPATLLGMSGGTSDSAALLATQVEGASHRGFYARLPLTAARLVREQARLDEDFEVYQREASRMRAAFEARDLGILTDDGVATTLRDLQRFLDRTGTLMLTCASNALSSFLALRMLLQRTACDGDEPRATRLAADVTAGGAGKGLGDLESARPTIALARVAEIALRDEPAKAMLLEHPPRAVHDLPAGSTRDALDRWVAAYGDRAVCEAELATPRWREDQSFPLATLALYVQRGAAGLPYAPMLDEASHRASTAMERLETQLGFASRTALRHLVARCHKFARLREQMRAWVTWVLGGIRVAVLEANRRLSRRDPAIVANDVFFCTVDEILAALRGEARPIDRIIAARRAQHARDLARPDPPDTFVGRPPFVHVEPSGGPTLHGHGACAGVVTGPVRVLATPEQATELRPGEILVTRTTDVGWTPLFVAAAGVVTELGGPLSHAAIVARELGVPCVVNVQGALKRLRDGMTVRLDGDRGVVEIL